MAEQKQEEKEKKNLGFKKPDEKEHKRPDQSKEIAAARSLVRIMGTDIPGEKSIHYGLTRIKGISYAFSSALCHALNLDKGRKILSLSQDEIKKISDFATNPKLPTFLLNRRRDLETGQDKHLTVTPLDLQKEFDIRRLKKIRSYRGWRHAKGLPVRGQRTKAHFREGRAVGVVRSKMKPGSQAAAEKSKEKK